MICLVTFLVFLFNRNQNEAYEFQIELTLCKQYMYVRDVHEQHFKVPYLKKFYSQTKHSHVIKVQHDLDGNEEAIILKNAYQV